MSEPAQRVMRGAPPVRYDVELKEPAGEIHASPAVFKWKSERDDVRYTLDIFTPTLARIYRAESIVGSSWTAPTPSERSSSPTSSTSGASRDSRGSSGRNLVPERLVHDRGQSGRTSPFLDIAEDPVIAFDPRIFRLHACSRIRGGSNDGHQEDSGRAQGEGCRRLAPVRFPQPGSSRLPRARPRFQKRDVEALVLLHPGRGRADPPRLRRRARAARRSPGREESTTARGKSSTPRSRRFSASRRSSPCNILR